MRVTPLNLKRTDETVIASTIEGGWKTTVDAQEIVFPQFKQFRVSQEDARYLISKASRVFSNRKEQCENERKMWARKISSFNQAEKDKALRFCTADGTPLSVPFPDIPLHDLGTEAGQAAYQRAWERAREQGKLPAVEEVRPTGMNLDIGYVPDPDAGSLAKGESRKFEREAYGEDESVPASTPPASAQAQVEGPEPEPQEGRLPVRIKRPSSEWAAEDLEKYCKSKGFNVTKNDHKIEGKLLDLAQRAHAEHTALLKKSGVKFEEV